MNPPLHLQHAVESVLKEIWPAPRAPVVRHRSIRVQVPEGLARAHGITLVVGIYELVKAHLDPHELPYMAHLVYQLDELVLHTDLTRSKWAPSTRFDLIE